MMYTVRYLGAEGFGVLSFALAFTGMFGVFTDLGLSMLTTREIAKDKSQVDKYIGNIAPMKIVLVVITFILVALAINFSGYPEKTIEVIYLVALSVIFAAFTNMFNSIFQAFEEMEYISIGRIISSVLMLLGVLIGMKQGFDVVGFASIYFIVSAVVLIYCLAVYVRKFDLPKIKVDLIFWRNISKEAVPFAITGISINIYLWINTIMLSLLKGDEVVGWYNAAYRLILFLLFIPIIFNNSVFPVMSKYFISSKNSLKLSFEKLFKLMVLFGLPLGIGTTILADKIILLIYGEQFDNSIIVLQLLIWSLVLIFTRSAFERLLESSNKQVLVTKIFIVGAIFSIVANLILIPKYSYIGAGIATVSTDIMVLISLIFITRNHGFFIQKKELFSTCKIISAGITMGVFLKYSLDLSIFINISSAIFVYIITVIALKIIDEDEIALIKSIFWQGGKSEV